MIASGEIVAWKSLWQSALAAGVGITFVFACAILGLSKLSEARESGNALSSLGWGALFVFGIVGTVAGVVLGLIAVTHKS